MAILCRSHRLLFIMAPRTGCTAIGTVLREEFDGEWFPAASLVNVRGHTILQRKHSTLADLRRYDLLSPDDEAALHIIATVRNPFDSLVSLYTKLRESYQPLLSDASSWVHTLPGYVSAMKYCQTHSFSEWLRRTYPPPTPIRSLIRPRRWYRLAVRVPTPPESPYLRDVDQVMRFENLESDFNEALRRIGIRTHYPLPRINVTSERTDYDYRDFYTPADIAIVQHYFEGIIETYGYSF